MFYQNLKKSGRYVLAASLFLMGTVAMAQTTKVSGRVVDSNGEPVVGAAVVVAGTTVGSVTDIDGKYSIEAPADATLNVSFLGYDDQAQAVNGQSSINFTMSDNAEELDELVVVGYGVQKKSDVTGALVRVDEKALNARPVANAFEAMQGKAAGVDITSSERPGTVGTVRIRGVRSLSAGNGPLYVVDGVPLAAGGIEALNPRDIESIDILKDASSTAIYGSRGANGVVMITTRHGKKGAMKLNYSGSWTVEKIHDLSEAMTASDYITWRRWAYYNSNTELYTPGDKPTYEQDKAFFSGDDVAWANIEKGWSADHSKWDGSKVTDTDWTEFVTRTGLTQEHTLSANGGTDNILASASFGYLKNEGTQEGQQYTRFSGSVTVDITAKPWFKMGGTANFSRAEQDYGYSRTGQVGTSSGPQDLYSAAKDLLRYTLPYDETGEIVMMPGGTTTNTYTVIDEWKKSTDNRETFRTLASIYGLVDFGGFTDKLEGLTYKISFGPDFRHQRQGIFIDASSAARKGGNNYAKRGDDRYFSWTLDNMITYNTKIADVHSLGITLLQSASKNNHESGALSATNIPMPSFLWNHMSSIDISDTQKYSPGMSTGITESQMSSYMARVNYGFMDKYLLTVSGRYDGASVLAEGNKWDFFPSAALGWRIDQESFMANQNVVSQLKLRAGVGTTGNSSVSAYQTLGTVNSYWMPFSTGNSQILVTNEPYYTNSGNAMPNKELGWEKTTQFNLGVDFGLNGGRVNGTIDFYHSATNDIIMNMKIPTLSGYPTTYANIGKTKNTGVDITINAEVLRIGDFAWNSNLNAAWQKDEIVELANGKEDDVANSWFIGESINVFYGIKADGIWGEKDAAEMAKFNENGHKFTVGSVRPVDQDHNYKIDEDDRVILGNKNPRWTLGWTNTFSWKGLELNVELYGRFKYMVNLGGEAQYGMYQQRDIDYWTPGHDGAEWQKPVYSTAGGDSYSSLLGYKDASFIKLRNLSLGYNLDKALVDKLKLQGVKVYVQGKNLGCLASSVDYVDLDLGTSYYNRGVSMGIIVDF